MELELYQYKDHVTQSIQSIYDRIIELYKLEVQINLDDELEIPELKVEPCPTDLQNYVFYLWLTRVLQQLEKVLNDVIAFYNDSGFVDEDGYGDTAFIHLYIPRIEIFYDDDYLKKIENDLKLASDTVDRLFKYAKQFED
mgnify:FL=1